DRRSGGAFLVGEKDAGPKRPGQRVAVVLRIHLDAESDLFEVVGAMDDSGAAFGGGERGQKKTRENGNDRDDNEKFDQRERGSAAGRCPPILLGLHIGLASVWRFLVYVTTGIRGCAVRCIEETRNLRTRSTVFC